MNKIQMLLARKREHYKNRLKKRNGSSLWFLFAKVIDEKQVFDPYGGKCLVWKYRNHIYLTQHNQLQTYIKKSLLT